MSDAKDHSQQVAAWMKDVAKGLSSEQLLQLFEQAMGALWNRAHLTLGDVTLSAIMDRVLYNAAERFPPFESLNVESNGIDFQELRERENIFDKGDLAEAIRFVIVASFVVIGNLTGEILTPALHSELSKIMPNPGAASTRKENHDEEGGDLWPRIADCREKPLRPLSFRLSESGRQPVVWKLSPLC